jgi:hypothetical protein
MITIHYANGREDTVAYSLSLSKSWPLPASTTMRLSLENIKVIWDGSSGSTGWKFDLLAGGKPLLQLPNRNYDDGKDRSNKQNDYALNQTVGTVAVARGPVVVEVRGERSFPPHDKATGVATLTPKGGPFTVFVVNESDPKKGSFVFSFATQVQ